MFDVYLILKFTWMYLLVLATLTQGAVRQCLEILWLSNGVCATGILKAEAKDAPATHRPALQQSIIKLQRTTVPTLKKLDLVDIREE